MGFGDVGHVLTNTVTGSSDQDWTCYSAFIYSRDGNAPHAIEYDGTNWIDHSSADWPTHFGTSSTDGTAVTPVGTDTDLYLWNGSTFVCKLVNPDPETSGGGSGGGTSNEGFSYSATLEVNSNGWLEYTIPTTSSSGTYYLLKSSDGGVTWTQHGENITHGVLETQGSFAFDQTLIWIIRSPTEDELARWSPPSSQTKVFCNFW